ncbi:cysteine-rich secretory protein family domain-containing protein [Ditylenchus destructor]|uniref:Cysteine-rich secretory protein family domain-containing protein n=1 Tax=Ditylenchus destructor TaxID=166010 RepID=A0AAD4MNK4_9BILA|nr:cysteine-rich secretory protein family domain-containing protein [Ditylenchus destructor]
MANYVLIGMLVAISGICGCMALTDSERQLVLSLLNGFRSDLAKGKLKNPDGTYLPSGSSIYGLKYSSQLEALAQSYANKCIVSHRTYEERNRTSENLYYNTGLLNNTYALQNAMNWWWGEQAQYGFYTPNQVLTAEDLKCNPDCDGTIGHWSYMAWETTREFGCGVAQCPNGSDRTGPNPITYVVCNLSPSGNVINQRVYISGPPCTATTGCVNSPASTCDVSTSLCFVSDAPKTTASPKTTGKAKNSDGTYLPSGSSIYGLTYNQQLETLAQNQVVKCTPEKGATYEERNGTGQIYYYTYGSVNNNSLALQYAMQWWWGQLADKGFYTPNLVFANEDFQKTTGWANMAWETVREVGCGVAQCPGRTDLNPEGITLIACNYGPSGAQLSVNKPIYKSGTPCTKTSGCVNTPASTCDVESSLCFVGGVPATKSLSDADRKVVISVHNGYRSTLAKGKAKNSDGTYLPSGSSIYGLTYNQQLETLAQNQVVKCTPEKGATYEERNGTGQIYYYTYGSVNNNSLALQYAMQWWWGQLADKGFYTPNLVFANEDFQKTTGWANMAWETVREVGCGVARCPGRTDINPEGITLIACNYGPSGAQLSVNKPVYKSGPPCTKTSGCANTPASTCDVENSLCFVGGVPASGK